MDQMAIGPSIYSNVLKEYMQKTGYDLDWNVVKISYHNINEGMWGSSNLSEIFRILKFLKKLLL